MPQGGGNSDCAHWCADNFAHPGGCTSLAAHGKGPCYDCGPANTNPADMLCSGECTDTSSDASNCGACGNTVRHVIVTFQRYILQILTSYTSAPVVRIVLVGRVPAVVRHRAVSVSCTTLL